MSKINTCMLIYTYTDTCSYNTYVRTYIRTYVNDGNVIHIHTYVTCTQYVPGCWVSLVLIIPDTVEPQHLLVMVQELPEGVQFLIWSQGLHGFQHLKLGMETGVHTYVCMYKVH